MMWSLFPIIPGTCSSLRASREPRNVRPEEKSKEPLFLNRELAKNLHAQVTGFERIFRDVMNAVAVRAMGIIIRQKSERAIDQTNRSSDPRRPTRAPNEFQLIQLSAVLISSGRFHERISPALVFGDPLMAKCRNVAYGGERTGRRERQAEKAETGRESDADGPA